MTGAVQVDISSGPDGEPAIVPVAVGGAHSAVAVKSPVPLIKGRVAVKAMGSHGNAAVIPGVSVAAQHSFDGPQGRMNRLLQEDVVVEPVVPMEEGHKARNLRPMGYVVWGVPRGRDGGSAVVGADSHGGKGAAHQIVHHGNALGRQLDCPG